MRIHNNVDVLTYNASVCAAIVANPGTGDFVLLDMDAPPLPEQTRLELLARGFVFAGCCGIVEDEPEVQLEVPLAPRTVHAVKVAFLAAIGDTARRARAAEDFPAWMSRLWSLRDTRTEN